MFEFISGIVAILMLICFFVLCTNVASINKQMKEQSNKQDIIIKGLTAIFTQIKQKNENDK